MHPLAHDEDGAAREQRDRRVERRWGCGDDPVEDEPRRHERDGEADLAPHHVRPHARRGEAEGRVEVEVRFHVPDDAGPRPPVASRRDSP